MVKRGGACPAPSSTVPVNYRSLSNMICIITVCIWDQIFYSLLGNYVFNLKIFYFLFCDLRYFSLLELFFANNVTPQLMMIFLKFILLQSWPKTMWTVAFDQLLNKNVKFTVLSVIPRPPLTMLCSNMLCKQVKIIMASTLFWGSGVRFICKMAFGELVST